MANPFATAFVKHYEHDVGLIAGFVALDGSSNVIGQAQVAAPVGTGPFTLLKGSAKALGIAGAVATQYHTSTGLYTFVLDEPWQALLGWSVNLLDQGAVVQPAPSVKANVRGNTTGPRAGVDPGTDTTIAAQNVQVRFRNPTTGALVDPAASTGFWLSLLLKRTAIY